MQILLTDGNFHIQLWCQFSPCRWEGKGINPGIQGFFSARKREFSLEPEGGSAAEKPLFLEGFFEELCRLLLGAAPCAAGLGHRCQLLLPLILSLLFVSNECLDEQVSSVPLPEESVTKVDLSFSKPDKRARGTNCK